LSHGGKKCCGVNEVNFLNERKADNEGGGGAALRDKITQPAHTKA